MTPRPAQRIDTPEDRIIIVAEFQKLNPDTLFDYFTVPSLLQKWWPPLAEVEPHAGGRYHFSWPRQG